MMYTLTHGAVVAEPLPPWLDDLRACGVDEGEEEEEEAGGHHPALAGADCCPHCCGDTERDDAVINIWSQMMPAEESHWVLVST